MKKFLIVLLLLGLFISYGTYRIISSPEKESNDSAFIVNLMGTNISDNNVNDKNSESGLKLINPVIRGDSDKQEEEIIIDESEKKVEGDQAPIKSASIVLKNTGPAVEGKGSKGGISTQSLPSVKKVSLIEKIKIHQVKKGENLWEIAAKYGIDINTLIGANDIADMNRIQIGDSLRILPVKGILYKINPGENLWTISRQFNVTIDKIVEANAIEKPDLVQPGTTLILPGAKPELGYEDRLGKQFIYPIDARISSYFGSRWGRQHEGIDFAVNTGTRIKAARAGKVIYSQWATGYGYTVVIEHQKGVRTLYAHNSQLLVHGGQWVEQGQVISLSGNTGNSTGPHLHFEIQINGQPVNPLNYLQ